MNLKADQENPELYRVTCCRYCKSPLGEPFLNLGSHPLANSFLKEEEAKNPEFVCPLRLVWCSACFLVQLTHVVPPEKMFSNYLYVSSTTQTFQKHFSDYAKEAKEKVLKKEGPILAVDIGSNDGLLLSCYQKEGMRAVGVEPAKNLSEEANQKGLTTFNGYFGPSVVEKILKEFGPADLISGNNVFAHVDKIGEVCQSVVELLSSRGLFIIEFPYLVTMVEKMLFDMIYHEHLSYLAVEPLSFLLKKFGLEIFAIESVASHGGSLRVFIQREGTGRPVWPEVEQILKEETRKGYGSFSLYEDFARQVYRVREKLAAFVNRLKKEGGTLSGYGAPAKGNTLINFCRWTSSDIAYIVDDNPLKQNLLTPGSHIPVVPSSYLFARPTTHVILFAWNFAEEILKKLSPLGKQGLKFIIPLPEPRIIESAGPVLERT